MRNKPENFHASYYSRVLFNFRSLPTDVPETVARQILKDLGFEDPNQGTSANNPAEMITSLARSRLVGNASYALNAEPKDWPTFMNCSGVSTWLYGQAGIEMPHLSIRQYHEGEPVYDEFTPKVGDLYFKSGKDGEKDYYDERDNISMAIGHVGMVIDVDDPRDAVICEAVSPFVKETPLKSFVREGTPFRGACRIVKNLKDWTVLTIPKEMLWKIRWSEDVRYCILSQLKKA